MSRFWKAVLSIPEKTVGGYEGNVDAEEINRAKLLQKREQAAETVGRTTNADFLNFRSSFLEQINNLKMQLNRVYTEKSVGLDELYDLNASIFSIMDYKMDAVLYLNAIYSSDYFIVEHCLRVGLLANILANWLGYDAERIKNATVAGFLHDIGMLQVPEEIIEKQGRLSPEEFSMLREHTMRGYYMIATKGVRPEVMAAVRSHHERFDGSGYPRGLRGREIGELTALVSIVDVYDSMTSNRPYRLATCPFDVMDFFEKQMIDKFNPGLLYVFLENIPYMYKGSFVLLSDGQSGKVVFIDKNHKTSPIVQIEKTGEMVDLNSRRDLKISSLL